MDLALVILPAYAFESPGIAEGHEMRRSVGRRDFLSSVAVATISATAFSGGILGAVAASVADENKSAASWKAGIARTVITPETSVWLAGYGTKRAPDGKLHDLWMKALALEDSKGIRAVLITSDFQGVPKMMSDRVFQQLKENFQLERSQIMFTFSHNHCGPRLGDDLIDYYPVEAEQEQLVTEYTDLMVERTVGLVEEALSRLAPASLQTGDGKTTFAVNRRNNREADVPDLIAKGTPLAGPVDHNVPVMTVTRPDGKLEAILFGYACHPTTLSFTTWCGDYPGFAQLELENNHPGTTAMFVNTCGGDQNPLPRRQVELCEKYGHMLAVAVEEVLAKPLKPVSSGLKLAFEMVDLQYLNVVSREELTTLLEDSNALKARWAKRLLAKLDAGDQFPAAYPYPIHAWQLGSEMLLIGMGAETVVDYALRFKAEFGEGTWVLGYADDMISYIPSRRVWDEGGYEGGSNLYEYGRPAFRWAGDIEDRIAATVHKLVKQVRE
jgi:neutral ceramidase